MLATALIAMQAGPLADLRVGEDEAGMVARVVVVCTGRCAAAPAPGGVGAYRIEGLSDDVSVSVDGPLVEAVSVARDSDAAVLRVETARPPRRVRLSRCAPMALCFDMDLSEAPPPAPPPTLGTIARGLEDVEARGAPSPLRADLEAASGEALTPKACAAARDRMMADPWALDAYRVHAMCVAASGAPGEADGYLARLQAYAPDQATARLRALLAKPADASRAP